MEGLSKFREAFEEFSDNYVIIGGTACGFTMAGSVVRPRATHDIDMIVIVENMTAEFGARFWQFVAEAGYRPEKSRPIDGKQPKYELYRFVDGKPGYPAMIELLSRHPDVLGEPQNLRIEPLPISDGISSLSAIIMDDDMYHFTIKHSTLTDGIRHADSAALIVLKTKAYLNLCRDKAAGLHINSKDIKKHRSDVFRNLEVTVDEQIPAPESIVQCVREFVESIRSEWDSVREPLSNSLSRDPGFVEELINQLEALFVKE